MCCVLVACVPDAGQMERRLTEGPVLQAARPSNSYWRGFIRVDELLGLSVVLAISPADLLVPKDLHDDQPYLITPNRTARATNAREFIRGEDYLYASGYSEAEPEPDPEDEIHFASPTVPIDPFQWMPADRANRLLEQAADRQDKINQMVEGGEEEGQ
jgi:hypothetical protein